MNKIITINIGGIAISIEEDAFDELRNYLKNISTHFSQTENGDEIIADIELRIGEMLAAKLKPPKVSVNTSDVEEVAQTMGYPSDFEAEDEGAKEETTSEQQTSATSEQTRSEKRKARRLFRDVDNKYVGGVCSGLARYFDLDPTVFRLLWVISIAVFGFGFWFYIILWAILPEPKTAAEKLEMMGEAPNIENIKNTIHSEAKAAYERIATPENRKSVASFIDGILNFLKRLFGVFFKLFAIAALVGVTILLIVSLIGFVFQGTFLNYGNHVNINGQVLGLLLIGSGSWLFKIAFYLIFAIPLLFIAMMLVPEVLSAPKPSKAVKQGLVSSWFIAIILAVLGFFYNAQQFQAEGTIKEKTPIELVSDTIIIRVDDLYSDNLIEVSERIRLNVVQSVSETVNIQSEKSSRGKSVDFAKQSTRAIADGYRLKGNTLIINERVQVLEKSKVNAPKHKITLRIPIGKTVIFHESTVDVIHDIDNIQNIYDPRMAGHSFYMSSAGLNCLDCDEEVKPTSKQKINGDFSRIEVEGALKIKITEGKPQNIEIPTYNGDTDWVKFSIKNGTLKLEQNDGIPIDNKEIVIEILNLESIKMSGACEADIDGKNREKSLLSVDLEGATKVRMKNINVGKITINMDGASGLTISGSGDLMLADCDGASTLIADNFEVDHGNLELDGSSTAKVFVSGDLTGDVSGASSLRYKGTKHSKFKKSVTATVKKMD